MVSDGLVWVWCLGKVIHNVGPCPQPQVGSLFIGFCLSTIVILTVINLFYFFEKRVPFSHQKLACIDTRNFAEAYH